MNTNKDAIEQRKKLTTALKYLYGSNYHPGLVDPKSQTMHYLKEDYIPFDASIEDDNSPNMTLYRQVMTDPNPNWDLSQKPNDNQSEPQVDESNFETSQQDPQQNQSTLAQPMTQAQRLQTKQMANFHGPKNVSIYPTTKNLIESPLARKTAYIYQGMANSLFNPFGYIARAKGIDIHPLQPEDRLERFIDEGSNGLFNAAVMINAGNYMANKTPFVNNLLSSGNTIARLGGKALQSIVNPGTPGYATSGAIGSAALPSFVNLQYPGEEASNWDKAKYYGGNIGLGIAGGLIGGGLTAGGRKATDIYHNITDAYKIGKGYDVLKTNPIAGNAQDVVTNINLRYQAPVKLQRGEAIIGENGKVIVQGKKLGRETASKRNYGLNKIIYKHELTKEQAQQIPRILRKNKPDQITPNGQYIYNIKDQSGKDFRIVISTKDGERFIATAYYPD